MRYPRTLRGRLALWFSAVLLLSLLSFAGAAAIASQGLAPMARVIRLAEGLDPEKLDARVEDLPGASEEAERLTRSINGMLDRIEASVNGIRRFTADASHELRTPLAVVMNDLEVALRRERTAAELKATAERALSELARLSRLVDSLLVLARSDAGQLKLERVGVDLAELARRLSGPFAERAREKGLTVEVAPAPGTPVRAVGDPLWLERSASNLLDNALKFTPQGGKIRLGVTATDGKAALTVDDSGPGVAREERERVFDRFFRGESVRGSTEGAGIGLAISRELTRLQGGEVLLAESPLGGARFVLELPADR